MAITHFRGENNYLSNMFVVVEGIMLPTGEEVPTVEHAYQAAKFPSDKLKLRIIAQETGAKAKRKAEQFKDEGKPFARNWSYEKVNVMRGLVHQKFTRSQELGHRLIDTGDEEIIEGNTWEDTFWGVYPIDDHGKLTPDSTGANFLGAILMETRAELQLIEKADEKEPQIIT